MVRTQVVFDDEPSIRGKDLNHSFQECDMTLRVALSADDHGCFSGSRLEGAVHPECASPLVIRLKGGSLWSSFPFGTRVDLGREGAEFVDADHARSRGRMDVGCDDGPLFSAKRSSCFSASWNQLCWRFQRRPSASTYSHIVEVANGIPSRSKKAVCRRSRVHIAKGRPSERGFWSARSKSFERTASPWIGGRPDRGRSSRASRPPSLNRRTHFGPLGALRYPARRPASFALRVGSSSIAARTWARCTKRAGWTREAATCRISVASEVETGRRESRFGIVDSHGRRNGNAPPTPPPKKDPTWREDHLVIFLKSL